MLNKVLSNIFSLLSLVAAMFFCVLYAVLSHNEALGGRSFPLTVIFIVGILVYFCLFCLKRFIRIYPFPVKITPENMAFQASFAKLATSILSFLLMCAFISVIYIKYCNLAESTEKLPLIPAYLPFIFVGASAAWYASYIAVARKHK